MPKTKEQIDRALKQLFTERIRAAANRRRSGLPVDQAAVKIFNERGDALKAERAKLFETSISSFLTKSIARQVQETS